MSDETFKQMVEGYPMPDSFRDGRDGSIIPYIGIWLSDLGNRVTTRLAALQAERLTREKLDAIFEGEYPGIVAKEPTWFLTLRDAILKEQAGE